MDVTSENLANAQTTRTAAGRPYQRQEVVLAAGPRLGLRLRALRRDGLRCRERSAAPSPAASQVSGDRQRPDARPARLRPRQPRRQRAGLRADAQRQPGDRDGRPDRRVQLLRGGRDGDADRQVDVHRDARACSSDPPDPALSGPLGQRGEHRARSADSGRAGPARRPRPASPASGGSFGGVAGQRDRLDAAGPDDGRHRRPRRSPPGSSATRPRRSPPSRTRSWRCSSPPRSAPKGDAANRRSSHTQL